MVHHPPGEPGNLPPVPPPIPHEPWKEAIERLDQKVSARAFKLLDELNELAQHDDPADFDEKITSFSYAHDVYGTIERYADKMDEDRFVELRARAEALQTFLEDTKDEAQRNPDGPAPGHVISVESIMQHQRPAYDVAEEFTIPRPKKDEIPKKGELINIVVQIDDRGKLIANPSHVSELMKNGSHADVTWTYHLPSANEHLKETIRAKGRLSLLFKVRRVEGTKDSPWLRRDRAVWLDSVGEFAQHPTVEMPSQYDVRRQVYMLRDGAVCEIPDRVRDLLDMTTGYLFDPRTKRSTKTFPQIKVRERRVRGKTFFEIDEVVPREVAIRRDVPHVAQAYHRANETTAFYTLQDGNRYRLQLGPHVNAKIDFATGKLKNEAGELQDVLPFVKVAFDPDTREWVVRDIAPASYAEKIRQVEAVMRYYALQPFEGQELDKDQKQFIELLNIDKNFYDIDPDLTASLRRRFAEITKEHPHYVVVSAPADSFRSGFQKCTAKFIKLRNIITAQPGADPSKDANVVSLLDELEPMLKELHQLFSIRYSIEKQQKELSDAARHRMHQLHVQFFKTLGKLDLATGERLRSDYFPSDLDGELSIDLLQRSGGINSIVIPVLSNDAEKMVPLLQRMIHIDISHESGKYIERASDGDRGYVDEHEFIPFTIFLDEDGKTRFSAVAAVLDHLRYMGMEPRASFEPNAQGARELFAEFVSAIDTFSGPYEERDTLSRMMEHWGNNIFGIAHQLNKMGHSDLILRFFADVGPQILQKIYDRNAHAKPQFVRKHALQELTQLDATRYFSGLEGGIKKIGLTAANNAAKDLENARKGFDWLLKNGFVVETDYGRTLVDVAQTKVVPDSSGKLFNNDPYYLGKIPRFTRAYVFAPSDSEHKKYACDVFVAYRPNEVDGTPTKMGTVNVAPWAKSKDGGPLRLGDPYLTTPDGRPIGKMVKNGRYFVMNPFGPRLENLAQLLGPLCKKYPEHLPERDRYGKLEQFLRFERGTAANPFEGEVVGGPTEWPPLTPKEVHDLFKRHAETLFKGITAEHMTHEQAQLVTVLARDGSLEQLSADRSRPQDRVLWEKTVADWWHQLDAFTREALTRAAQNMLQAQELRERIDTNALMFAGILQTRPLTMRAELYRRLKAHEPLNLQDEGVARAVGGTQFVPAFESYIRDQWFGALSQGERYFWDEQLRNRRPLAVQIERLTNQIAVAKQNIYRVQHGTKQMFGLRKVKDRSPEMADLVHWQEQLKIAQREWFGLQTDQWIGEQLTTTYEQLDRVAAGRGWETGAVASLGAPAVDSARIAAGLSGIEIDNVQVPLQGVMRAASAALAGSLHEPSATVVDMEVPRSDGVPAPSAGTLQALQQAINRRVILLARQGVSLEQAWDHDLAPLISAYEKAVSRMTEEELAAHQKGSEFLERNLAGAHRDLAERLHRALPNARLFEQPSRNALAGALGGFIDRVSTGAYEKHATYFTSADARQEAGLRFDRTVQPHDTIEGIVDGFMGQFHGVQMRHHSGVRERAVRRFLVNGHVDDPHGTFGTSFVERGRYTGTLHVGDLVSAVEDGSAPFGFRLKIQRAGASGVHKTHVDVDKYGRPEWLYEQRAADRARVWHFTSDGIPHYAGEFVGDTFEPIQLRAYRYAALDGSEQFATEDAANVFFKPDGTVVTLKNSKFGMDEGETPIGVRDTMPDSIHLRRSDGQIFTLNFANGEYRIAPSGEVFQRFPNGMGMRRIGFVSPVSSAPPSPDSIPAPAEPTVHEAIIAKQKLRSPFKTDPERQRELATVLQQEVLSNPERNKQFQQVVGSVHAYVRKTAALLLGRYPDELADDGWARWDVAKQLYYWRHPNESDQPYPIGDPLALENSISQEVVQQIADRMLGYLASLPAYQEQIVRTIGTFGVKKGGQGKSKKGQGGTTTTSTPEPTAAEAGARKRRAEEALEIGDDRARDGRRNRRESVKKSTGAFPSWKLAEIGRVIRTERKIPALRFEGNRVGY